MRFVARFVVLLVALSIVFDLMGRVCFDCLELERPFLPEMAALLSARFLGMLNEDWGDGSLAGLLWHYLPAIVASLSIAIAWTLIDIAWALNAFWRKAHMNRGPLPPFRRLALRFFVLLVVLSILFDLTGRIGSCFDPPRPFEADNMVFCSIFSVAMLTDTLGEGSLAGLLWHYLPAIVVSLSIAIAWTVVDRHRLDPERFSAKGHMNMAPLTLLCRLALRSAVLLFVLAALYDLSVPLSACFDPRPPILPETLPICFLGRFETQIFVARMGGLPGLAWHYLPVALVTVIVMIIWAREDCRGRRE